MRERGDLHCLHEQVGGSTGIKVVAVEDEEKTKQEFEDVAEQTPHLSQYLEVHLPSYKALKAHSLTV